MRQLVAEGGAAGRGERRGEGNHEHPERAARENRAREPDLAVAEERAGEHPGDRDPPELRADLDPVGVLQRERIHRNHDEVDRQSEPSAAEPQLRTVDGREQRLLDQPQALSHAIAAVDSWKSSSIGAPAARWAAGTPATASSPRIARLRARSRSSRSNGGLTMTACVAIAVSRSVLAGRTHARSS